MPRGIFGLRQTHDNQKAENWSVLSDVWLSFNGPFGKENPYGYFMGGDNNSRIFRLDFSNDTDNASIHAYSLDERDDGTAAFGNPNYAYITGGDTVSVPIDDTSIERLDYSNDTAGTVLMSGYSATIRHMLVAIGNENYGYFGAGHNGQSPLSYRTKLDRYDYSTDTVINSRTGFYDSTGNYTRSVTAGAAVGNQFFAYFAGGYRGFGTSSSIRRLDYANDTDKVQSRNSLLTGETRNFTASGDENGGYFMGGWSYDMYNGDQSIVSRLDYTNDTNALSPKSNLPSDKYNHCSTGNSKFGYVAGGSPYPTRSLIYRLNYSNDTTTDSFKTVGNLGQTGTFQYGAGVSATENALGLQNLSRVPALTTRDTGAAPQGTDFGYSGGGRLPAITTVIDRFDYSNDTTQAQVKGGLLTEMEDVASVSSANFGYFAGGFNNFTRYTYVYRVDYSNDSANSVAKGNLGAPSGNFSAEGVGNENFGYITGGGEPSITSRIYRIIYSNDTTTQFSRGNLEEALFDHGAVGTANFGYIAGGGGYSPPKSTIQRMQYADDTSKTLPKATLGSGGRNNLMATGNSEFGYFAGQFPSVSINERFDYSNDTVNAVTKGSLSSHRGSGSATGNQSKGYFMGGYDNNTALTSIVDRFDYSNDTVDAVHTAYLSDSVANNTATSSRENAIPVKGPGVLFGIFEKVVDGTRSTSDSGFLHSGTTGSRISSIERIDYSNDTVQTPVRGNLVEARQDAAGVGNENFGYVAGGLTPTSTFSNPTPYDDSTVERIDYLNDTALGLFKGPLTESRSGGSAVGNNSYGYVGGGQGGLVNSQINISSIDRIDYSNDVVTASARFSSPIAIRRLGNMATGNQSYGWFAGGINDDLSPDAPTSTVQRINYASDTSYTTRGYLNRSASFGAATGNANRGYFAGGTNYPTTPTPYVYYSSVSHIDYSNDLNQATPKGNLTAEQWKMAATGDANFGYFTGGALIDTRARTDRIDYANDTVQATPKGRLSVARYSHTASSARANGFTPVVGPAYADAFAIESRPSSTFGYFAGGDINPGTGQNTYTSVVDRIHFDNDTVTASVRAPLNTAKNTLAGVGNLTYGFIGGGYYGSPTVNDPKIERIDYANDTGDMTHRANLTSKWGLAACGNVDKSYFGGGDTSTGGGNARVSTVQRFDYSNETVTSVGDLGFSVRRLCAVGTQHFGYFTGGDPSNSGGSRMERLSYSNDTTDSISMSNTHNPGWGSAATGNANFGYIGGGNQYQSVITRYDYANDTSYSSNLGHLVSAQGYSLAATGNANFGYFGGNDDMISTVDRVDYSNDTVNASPKGPLSVGREELTGLGGGEDGNPQ